MTRKYLEGLGIDKEVIDKIMEENGKDIENARAKEQGKFETERGQLQGQIDDLQSQIETRDNDLTTLNEQLTAAQADAGKLTEAQTALTDLQSKYEADKQDWEARTAKQAYEFAVKTAMNGLKFSSAAAKRDFERGAIDKGLKMEGDKILGFDDYIKSYKEADPGAFAPDKPDPDPGEGGGATPPPKVVLPTNPSPSGEKGIFGFDFIGVRPHEK